MDSFSSPTNPRYPKMNRPSEYSSASGLGLKSSPTSSPTSAYLASSGSLNAKHRELLELELPSQRRARSRARLAEGDQDMKYGKRDLESSAYTPESEKNGEEEDNDEEVGEDEYVVEAITNHRVDEETGELRFEVKWEGYERKQDRTWEPEENLGTESKILNKYLASIGGKDQILSLWQEKKAEAAQTKGKITGRIPIHRRDICKPAKTFTRVQQLWHYHYHFQKPAYPCTFEDCERVFHRPDLLARHIHRHETQGENPYHRRSVDASSSKFSYSPERLSSMKIATSPSEVGHNKQSYYKKSAGRIPSRAPGNYNHLSERAPKNAFDLYCKDMRSVFAKRHTKEIADGSFDIECALARGWTAMGEEGRAEFLRKFEQVKKAAEVKKQGGAGGGGARRTLFDAGSRNADEDVEIAEERDDVDTLSYTEMNSPWRSSDSDSTYPARSDGPRNPMDKFAKTFKKMEGKAWKSSPKISGISCVISRDNTSGECARQAKLFAEFGQRRTCAFASSFAQHYDGAEK